MTRRLVERLLEELDRHGILLEMDSALPSVVTLITGEPVKGSWWGHAKGNIIYNVASELGDHQEVITAKLVSGKITYVHRRLWPSLAAIGLAKDKWQMEGLSSDAMKLLKTVEKLGTGRADQISTKPASTAAVKELEGRMLVFAQSVHTDHGKHVKELESWEHFAKRKALEPGKGSAEVHRLKFEEILADLNQRYKAKAKLPW